MIDVNVIGGKSTSGVHYWDHRAFRGIGFNRNDGLYLALKKLCFFCACMFSLFKSSLLSFYIA